MRAGNFIQTLGRGVVKGIKRVGGFFGRFASGAARGAGQMAEGAFRGIGDGTQNAFS